MYDYNQEDDCQIQTVTRLDYSSLQISLYFFLLIFFVLLACGHDVAPLHAKQAMVSVKDAFGHGGNFFVDNKKQLIAQKEQLLNAAKQNLLAEIKTIIPRDFDLLVPRDDGKLFDLTISTRAMFEQESTKIDHDKRFVLASLAKAIAENQMANMYAKLHIIIGVAHYLTLEDQTSLELAAARLAEIEGILSSNGIENNRLVITIRENMPTKVSFALYWPA